MTRHRTSTETELIVLEPAAARVDSRGATAKGMKLIPLPGEVGVSAVRQQRACRSDAVLGQTLPATRTTHPRGR